MTNHSELDVARLQSITGGAAKHKGFYVDPLVLKWKLQNTGKALPKWLGGKIEQSLQF